MKIQAADFDQVDSFVRIYNSAILLFPESQRANASPAIFRSQFRNQYNFICTEEDTPCGFASYRIMDENLYELGSLYVSIEYQKKGVGRKLLEYIESKIPRGAYLYAKVLSNAPWSVLFYGKNGFVFAEDKDLAVLRTTQNNWERVMWKIV